MEAIFCLGAAASAPSFPAGPNGRRRATRLPGAAVPVACTLSRGAVAAPLPWGTKPTVQSSTRTAAGGGDGSPGPLEDFLKPQLPLALLPDEEALTAILPLEKRFQLLKLLNKLALAKDDEVIISHVPSEDWLSSDEKLNAAFALSLVYFQKKEYAKAKQVLETLLRYEAPRAPLFMGALIATMLGLEIHLPKDKRT